MTVCDDPYNFKELQEQYDIGHVNRIGDSRENYGRFPLDQNFRKFRSNGTESFWKFVSKISVHLSRLSFFWISGNFLLHLAFLPGVNRPQFLLS